LGKNVNCGKYSFKLSFNRGESTVIFAVGIPQMKLTAPSSKAAINAPIDIFGRDEFANGLLNIFKTSDDPLVIALDDEWGTGKTVFARRLEKKAASVGVNAIYYDAFKRDYNSDVFVSLVSEIIAQSPQPENTTDLKDKAIGVAKVLRNTLLKGVVRVATAGIINSAGLDEAQAGIANEVSDAIEGDFDKLIDERLSNAAKDEMSFEAFRNALSALVEKNENGESTPLVFIIDELDRCRPDHALELLETIKHFFAVDHVHFLLVTNLNQMRAAVNKRYGLGDTASLYLEKFINFPVSFPVLGKHRHEMAVEQFLKNIISEMPDDNENGGYKDKFLGFSKYIFVAKNYSLRRMERICTSFAVCLKFTNKESLREWPIVHVLCDMRISNPEMFRLAKNRKLSYDRVKEHYNFPGNPEENNELSIYAKCWMYCLKDDIDINSSDWTGFHRSFGSGASRKDYVCSTANNVIEPLLR
jgi:KAP family P-loop domain